jgi:hypothetical protein
MSYKDLAHYVAEINTKNPLKADFKTSVGILPSRNAPGYQTNDKYMRSSSLLKNQLLIF